MYVTDENMQTLTDLLGNIYLNWLDTFDSDSTKRDSYAFLRKRLADYVDNKTLHYSVYTGTNLLPSEKVGVTDMITIADGYAVDSDNANVFVTEHDVTVTKAFGYNYPSSGYYGVLIGMYHDDIDNAANTKLVELDEDISAVQPDNEILLRDASSLSDLTAPLILHVGGEDILISSFSVVNKKLYINSDYNGGRPVSSHSDGDKGFVYKALFAKAICGAPVAAEYVPVVSAASFAYYPTVPDDFMLLSRVLVSSPITPATPAATPTIESYTDERFIGDVSQDLPFTSDESRLLNEHFEVLNILEDSLSYRTILDAFIQELSITNFRTSSDSSLTEVDFETYWNARPLQRDSTFKHGVQWEGFERFEFNNGFKKLWYENSGNQLLTTLALFSGDLLDNSNTSGVDIPEISSGEAVEVVSADLGAITPGIVSYAVTAVTSSGESPLSDFETITVPVLQPYNKIRLTWPHIAGVDYYHVYKKSSNFSTINDLRLTDDDEVTYALNGSGANIVYDDLGTIAGKTTRRGVVITDNTIFSSDGLALYAYVPIISDVGALWPISRLEDSLITDDALTTADPLERTTANEFMVALTLELPDGTSEQQTVVIPQGTLAGTSFEIGEGKLYTAVLDMSIRISEDSSKITKVGNRIDWSIQDVVFIQNVS